MPEPDVLVVDAGSTTVKPALFRSGPGARVRLVAVKTREELAIPRAARTLLAR